MLIKVEQILVCIVGVELCAKFFLVVVFVSILTSHIFLICFFIFFSCLPHNSIHSSVITDHQTFDHHFLSKTSDPSVSRHGGGEDIIDIMNFRKSNLKCRCNHDYDGDDEVLDEAMFSRSFFHPAARDSYIHCEISIRERCNWNQLFPCVINSKPTAWVQNFVFLTIIRFPSSF